MTKDNKKLYNTKCRHCSTENEIDKDENINNLDGIACKSCGKNILKEKDEHFNELSPSNYEHPLEKTALNTLRSIPGLENILKSLLKNITDRYIKTFFIQNYIRINENNFGSIYRKVEKISEIFDIGYVPYVFLAQRSPLPNAHVVGIDKGFIVLNSGILDLLSEKDIDGIIAHEMSHIKSNHILYKTLANVVGTLGVTVASVSLSLGMGLPNLSQLIAMPVKQSLRYWDRTSELSADRAELLVTRNYEKFKHKIIKLSLGLPKKYKEEFNLEEFNKQIEEACLTGKDDLMDKLTILVQESNESQPFPLWRIKQVKEWVTSDDFYEIIQGRYKRSSTKSNTKGSSRTAEQSKIKKEPENNFEKFVDDVKDFFGLE